MHEAKSQLSKLVERVEAGEEIVIARAGKPVARLVPMAAPGGSRSGVRFGGIEARRLKLSADFHAPLRDDDLLAP